MDNWLLNLLGPVIAVFTFGPPIIETIIGVVALASLLGIAELGVALMIPAILIGGFLGFISFVVQMRIIA